MFDELEFCHVNLRQPLLWWNNTSNDGDAVQHLCHARCGASLGPGGHEGAPDLSVDAASLAQYPALRASYGHRPGFLDRESESKGV